MFLEPFLLNPSPSHILSDTEYWANQICNNLPNSVEKIWAYVKRQPEGLKEMIRYVLNGKVIETTRLFLWDDIIKKHENGEIDDSFFNEISDNTFSEKRIAELYRDNLKALKKSLIVSSRMFADCTPPRVNVRFLNSHGLIKSFLMMFLTFSVPSII